MEWGRWVKVTSYLGGMHIACFVGLAAFNFMHGQTVVAWTYTVSIYPMSMMFMSWQRARWLQKMQQAELLKARIMGRPLNSDEELIP